MAGLDPATHHDRSAGVGDSFRRADAYEMDGRLKATHDELGELMPG
jgi:hypothetical protein